jgi:nicotinamidase-related amidase
MPLREPLGRDAVHLCIDMQRIFAEATEWHTPSMAAVTPNILRLAAALPTLWSRFTVPETPAAATGQWQRYYERWSMFTGERMDPGLVDLVPELAAVANAADIYDKPTYSLFETPAFVERLARDGVRTLVLTGVETDVCVLATLFAAVDRGFRVVAVSDALTSSDPASHAAIMELLLPRMPDQVEIAGTDEVLAAN